MRSEVTADAPSQRAELLTQERLVKFVEQMRVTLRRLHVLHPQEQRLYALEAADMLAALLQHIAALTQRVALLEQYAGHRWTCDANLLDPDDATKLAGKPCTCGFDAALPKEPR